MRLKNLFGMAAMLALAASCSENALVQGGDTGASETGTSYAAFNIVLPTTNGTRADGDPTYEDGTTEEYQVNNGTILIFQKTGTEYAFIEKATLDLGGWSTPPATPDGITTEAKVTAQLKSVSSAATSDYYALVLLNNNNAVSTPTSGKYSTWNNAAQAKTVKDLIGANKDNFLMTNAALKGDNPFNTLVKIDKTKIYATKDAAAGGEAAAEIYVQRAVAKVTAKVGTGTGISGNTVNVKGSTTDAVEFNKWALDVTNKKTFPVQNISTLDEGIWEFARNTVNYTVGNQNRLFWAIDPNYNNGDLHLDDETGNEARAENFNKVIAANITNDMGTSDYCLENTFDLTNQKQGQTTRVVFKATYKVNNAAATFHKIGNNREIMSSETLAGKIKAAAQEIYNATGATGEIVVSLGSIGTTASAKHMVAVENIKVKVAETETQLAADTEYGVPDKKLTGTQIVKAVNDNLGLTTDAGISTYPGGATYYIARIKHFGDTYTPWKSGDPAYGPDKNNYRWLGRYGVLRNNWYELQVNSVSGPGYPTIPPVKPSTPDDESENYISCTIKILDWAKRVQDIDL